MTDSETLGFLLNGLRHMHSTNARREFLAAVWTQRAEFARWLQVTDERFFAHALPVFLHGGSSVGKIVVMGVNPGWRQGADEQLEAFLAASAARYVSFHEDFYDHFERSERLNGTSHFWNNLRSKLVALRPELEIDEDKWTSYRAHLVVQDLFPFHSRRKLTDLQDAESGTLSQIADATIEGLLSSAASEVWAFSPEAHAVVNRATRRKDFSVTAKAMLEGCTTTGQHRRVELLVAEAERPSSSPLRFVAVANALLTQPKFPFDKMLCRGDRCLPRRTMAAQILAACRQA